ncbi:glycoside hydrolase family 38 C-terminal domain-containing protein [Cohnella sp. GCM10020058]|uniref:glycoside hydrolase family 38 N-terminal domain-containing protein n=1 Tax=Cohnella sp. GCM10020058 TaxID=3317330 RepID=UPI0036288D9C
MKPELQQIHLISHVHWDREWYLPMENFRFRLVGIMDKLLERLEADDSFRFHLDGQGIVLDDYLEIKPQNKERIKKLVQAGRLAIGPWYVLFDAFLVSGESFIRNYEEGVRICAEFGAYEKLGYLPDTFSHLGQMPLILRQLGISQAVVWRGLNGTPEEVPSEFQWEATSGDRVLAVHLSHLYGYTAAHALPVDPEKAADRIRTLLGQTAGYSLTGHALLMNGMDHMEPQANLEAIVSHWNEIGEAPLKISSFRDLFAAIAASNAELPVIRGELRKTNHMPDSHINQVMPGVLSSRIYLKQQNAEVQTWMEKLVEPLEAIGSGLGLEQHPAFVRLAWKYVLQNHPHDSICGCSIDEVHDEMETRYAKAMQLARQLVHETACRIAARADTAWIDGTSGQPVVFVNALPWKRGALVEFDFDVPASSDYRSVSLTDGKGRESFGEILYVHKQTPIQSFSERYPLSPDVYRHRIRAYIADMPALGYKAMSVRLRRAPALPSLPLQSVSRHIENEFVKLVIEGDGSLTWIDKETGDSWNGLHYFEDGGDAGDGYLYSAPISDRKYYSVGAVSVAVTSEGYGWSVLEATYRICVPESLSEDDKSRSRAMTELELTTRIKLSPGARTAVFETETVNAVEDHRVRLVFPLAGKRGRFRAGGQFDMLEREERVVQPAEDHWLETERTMFPYQHFLAADTDRARFVWTTEGLHEYEWVPSPDCAKDDPADRGSLALTLWRSVSHLGAAWRGSVIRMPTGPYLPTPGCQCLRKLEFRYSLTIEPSGKQAGAQAPWTIADECRTPVPYVQLPFAGNRADGQALSAQSADLPKLPNEQGFVLLKTSEVQVSSIRPCLDGSGIEVRLANLTNEAVTASLSIALPVVSIERGLADGTILEKLEATAGAQGAETTVDVQAKNVTTLFVRLAGH